ncbi:MAG: hypothetical protein AAGF23_08175 [Acidobacteriota bacterium]
MIRRTLTLALLTLSVSLFASPAFAADANFQVLCNYVDPDSFVCQFDALSTPSGQTPTSCGLQPVERYIWRFGDGASAVTTTPETQHVYLFGTGTPSFFSYYEACLSIECADGSTAFKCHCVNLYGSSIAGCAEPGAWSPI